MMMVAIHTYEKGGAIQVVVHSEQRGEIMTEEKCDMMMMVVAPTHIPTTRNEYYLRLLFSFYYQEVHQAYTQCEKGVFSIFLIQVNKVDEHGFFSGR